MIKRQAEKILINYAHFMGEETEAQGGGSMHLCLISPAGVEAPQVQGLLFPFSVSPGLMLPTKDRNGAHQWVSSPSDPIPLFITDIFHYLFPVVECNS